MTRPIKAVLFDLDGLLHNSQDFIDFAFPKAVHAMCEYGLRAQSERQALARLAEIYKVDPNAPDHFNQLCMSFNNDDEDPLVIAAGVRAYHNAKLTIQPPSAVRSVLETLANRYSSPTRLGLGVVTNGRPTKQAEKLLLLQIEHFFMRYERGKVVETTLFASDTSTIRKPNLALLQQAQQQMMFQYNRAVMVGDRIYTDVLPGNLLGMYTIHIPSLKYADETPERARDIYSRNFPGVQPPALDQFRPSFTIASIDQLPDTITRIERTLKNPTGPHAQPQLFGAVAGTPASR